jgi:hypothetical protein
VDQDRIKAVGPEKAAAEWLLRCGAKIKWRGQQNFLSDYNAMELTSGPNVKIAGTGQKYPQFILLAVISTNYRH